MNISPTAGGYFRAPGIYTNEQVEVWKPVTKAVHDKGSKIVLQLWYAGRVSHRLVQPDDEIPVCPSATPIPADLGISAVTPKGRMPFEAPRVMEIDEIPCIIKDYAQAALNAVEAGFDGVELHLANGFLLEQFLCDNANKRTDKYGGSIENRARLMF